MRKLSDIHGEDAMELTAMLISIGREVAMDKDLKKYIYGKKPQGKSDDDWNAEFASEFFNTMLRRHRNECIDMMAKVEGVSREEYLADADPTKVVNDLGDLMSDKEFGELFFSLAPSRVKTKTSGSGSENTQDLET